MEKLFILFGILSLVFLVANNDQKGFSFAIAGTQVKLNPVTSLIESTSRVFFEGMDKVKEEIGKVGTEVKGLISKLETQIKNGDETREKTKEAIELKLKDIEELNKKQQDHLDALETRIKKGDINAKAERDKDFNDHFDAAINQKQIDGKSVADKLQLLKGKKEGVHSLSLDMKAAATMLISGNYSGGTVGLTTWDSELTRPARRQPFLRQIVTVRPINSLYVAYAELKNRDGSAGQTAEGAAKSMIDFDFVEASMKVEKTTAYIKTSKEALDDIVGLRSEINTELVEAVNLKLDDQILNGSGTTPNLKGIITYLSSAISLTGTPFLFANGGVASANNFDVIRAAVAVVANNFFQANYAIVHPYDLAAMELVKDSNGQYVLPPFSTANGANIAGVRVIANTNMTQGNFLVGDFTKDILGIREELNIQIGYENDDFTKNLVTILAELRAVNYIKSNNVGAFVRGTFSTVKTAMTA